MIASEAMYQVRGVLMSCRPRSATDSSSRIHLASSMPEALPPSLPWLPRVMITRSIRLAKSGMRTTSLATLMKSSWPVRKRWIRETRRLLMVDKGRTCRPLSTSLKRRMASATSGRVARGSPTTVLKKLAFSSSSHLRSRARISSSLRYWLARVNGASVISTDSSKDTRAPGTLLSPVAAPGSWNASISSSMARAWSRPMDTRWLIILRDRRKYFFLRVARSSRTRSRHDAEGPPSPGSGSRMPSRSLITPSPGHGKRRRRG